MFLIAEPGTCVLWMGWDVCLRTGQEKAVLSQCKKSPGLPGLRAVHWTTQAGTVLLMKEHLLEVRWGERFPLARAVELPLVKSPTASLASWLSTISVTPRQRMGRVWSTLLPPTCPSLKGPPSPGLPHCSPCSYTKLAQPRQSWTFGLDGSSSWALSWAAELGPTH